MITLFSALLNAKQVRFGLSYGEDEPFIFDVPQATLVRAPNPLSGFIAPLVEGLPIDKWHGEYHPTFAGRPIELEEFEQSRSLAIRRDRAGFVLGTSLSFRAFDAQGRQRWRQIGPQTSGVNFSADGHILKIFGHFSPPRVF